MTKTNFVQVEDKGKENPNGVVSVSGYSNGSNVSWIWTDEFFKMGNKSLPHTVKTMPKIKKVMCFESLVTKVWWSDGTTTEVRCGDRDTFNPEFGLAMCIAKKYSGNYENFHKSLLRTRHSIGGKLHKVIEK
ncbi:MAG: hypothetical protein WA061_02745 [Microgenomates group bacterium]